MTHLAQIIPMMKAKQIDINWSRLYNDILFWGDSSTTQFAWKKQFCATPVAKNIKVC
ncbi:type I-E CRISPR-associated protein Cse2/CasB [Streptomyces niveiscabiei]|uniref:type I-E CRISPR-associated protein Cse2/CasB n=1 Tax=Streptomyces niveiscabiei TaxID=164115 RepID=UPI0038F79435